MSVRKKGSHDVLGRCNWYLMRNESDFSISSLDVPLPNLDSVSHSSEMNGNQGTEEEIVCCIATVVCYGMLLCVV